MPGNPLEVQDFTPVLKNYYLPFRKKVFPINTVAVAQARKIGADSVDYTGNDLFFDVKVDRRGGFVSSAKGYFPKTKNAREKQGRLSVARMYASAGVDGLALKTTENGKGSYISAAKKMVEDVMEQWEIEQERVIHGDSLGIRGVIGTVTDTTHIIISAPYGITSAGPGSLHLVEGDTISVRSSTGATHRGKSDIALGGISLSGDNATLTLSTAIAGMQVGDLVFTGVIAAVHATDDSFGAEPHGFKSIVDVEGSFATFEGINDDRWVAQKITSTTVDELVLMRLLNTIRAKSNVDTRKSPKDMLLLTTTGIWQTYGEAMLGLRRFAAPTMTINGGFTATQVAGAALVDDPWAPRGRLYAIHGPDTIFIDLMEFGKIGYGDAPKWRPMQNQDGFEAIFGFYGNYGVTVRNSHGVISGITDTVNYSPVGA